MRNNRHKVVDGLREAISYAKGDRSRARVSVYNVPENVDVKTVREGLGMSQAEFAIKFGFSVGTLRQWEQGRRYPDGAARVLLTVIKNEPAAVKKALRRASNESPPQKVATG